MRNNYINDTRHLMKNVLICLVTVSILGIVMKSTARVIWKAKRLESENKSEEKETNMKYTNDAIDNEQLSRDLITRSEAEVELKLTSMKKEFLVIDRDGTPQPRIMNYNTNRILLTIKDGKVTGVDFG